MSQLSVSDSHKPKLAFDTIHEVTRMTLTTFRDGSCDFVDRDFASPQKSTKENAINTTKVFGRIWPCGSNWGTGTVQPLDHFANLLVMPKLMITKERNRRSAVDLTEERVFEDYVLETISAVG